MMKRFLVGLLVAACLVAAPVVAGDTCTGPDGNHAQHVHAVPTGDHISHVADDGSYRDNDKGVWVDACGKEYPLCPKATPCPPEKECPEPTIVEMVQCSTPEITQVDVTINFTEVNELPRFLQGWSVQAVVGQNEFRGIQARKGFFGMRAGRMDMSEFPQVRTFGDDPIEKAIFGGAVAGALKSGNDDDEGDDDYYECVCHKPGTPAEHTVCSAEPSQINGHLGHGDYMGECEGDDPKDPYCGDGVLNRGETCENCPQDAGECPDDPFCGDGIVNNGETCETCPEDAGKCDDPDDPRDLGWQSTDDEAETLEAFVYIDSFLKREDRCFNEDGDVKAICRLGLYVGGGVVRYEEERIFVINDELRAVDDRYKFKLTGTAGVDYTFPFRLTVGAGYHTEAGVLVHAGYGIVW
jgi:hypothetical protein